MYVLCRQQRHLRFDLRVLPLELLAAARCCARHRLAHVLLPRRRAELPPPVDARALPGRDGALPFGAASGFVGALVVDVAGAEAGFATGLLAASGLATGAAAAAGGRSTGLGDILSNTTADERTLNSKFGHRRYIIQHVLI